MGKDTVSLKYSVALTWLQLEGGWRVGGSVEEQFEHAKAEAAGTHTA